MANALDPNCDYESARDSAFRVQMEGAQKDYVRALIGVRDCTRSLNGVSCASGWQSEQREDGSWVARPCECRKIWLKAFHELRDLNWQHRKSHKGQDYPDWLPEGEIHQGHEDSAPLSPRQAQNIAGLCTKVGVPIPSVIKERASECA